MFEKISWGRLKEQYGLEEHELLGLIDAGCPVFSHDGEEIGRWLASTGGAGVLLDKAEAEVILARQGRKIQPITAHAQVPPPATVGQRSSGGSTPKKDDWKKNVYAAVLATAEAVKRGKVKKAEFEEIYYAFADDGSVRTEAVEEAWKALPAVYKHKGRAPGE